MFINFAIAILMLAYVGLILAFRIGLAKSLNRVNSSNSKYFISIIVAFKDESKNLSVLMDSILNQNYPGTNFEIILVDDHSTDDSISIIESYLSKVTNIKLVSLPEHRHGKKAAIISGLEVSKYPIIALTDADCCIPSNWLLSISSEADKCSVLMLGPVVMSPIDSVNNMFQALDYASLMAVSAGSCGLKMPVVASSSNIAFRNDILKVKEVDLNPNVSSGDDMFLLHLAKKSFQKRISFLGYADSIVQTKTQSRLSDALEQRKRWASKSIYYQDLSTIIVGSVVLLFNLLIVLSIVLAFFKVEFLMMYLLLLTTKSFVDIVLLTKYLQFTKQSELLKVFIPLQLMYPFYITYSFFSGVITKSIWKGRTIK